MSNLDYSKTIKISATPDAIHQALTKEISGWWSEDLVADTEAFTIGFGETKKTFKVIAPPPAKGNFKVIWDCTAANLLHPDVNTPDEWVGTQIIWTVHPDGGTTNVTLTHVGLNSSLQCHAICIQGWDHFFLDSFKGFMITGQGKPFTSP